jgi:hypothetical protein
MIASRVYRRAFRNGAGDANRHFKGFIRLAIGVRVAKQGTVRVAFSDCHS